MNSLLTNHKILWELIFSILRITLSIVIVPILFKYLSTSEIILYGLISLITGITNGLDLGIQNVAISHLAKYKDSETEFLLELRPIRYIYNLIFIISSITISLVLFSSNSLITSTFSNTQQIFLAIHTLLSLIYVKFMWLDALLISKNKIVQLRKFQILGLVLNAFTILLLHHRVGLITSYILANSIYIIVYKTLIWRQAQIPKLNTWSLKWMFQIKEISIIKKIKQTIPANIMAVLSSKLVILIALNKLQPNENAAFVTVITALSFTSFIGQILTQSKSFELTNSIQESRKGVLLSVLWASGSFVLALLGMITFKNAITIFRPEIELFSTVILIIFFLSSLAENVASILTLPLLYNGRFQYVQNFLGTMSLLVISLLVLNYLNQISIYSIGLILFLFNIVYLSLNFNYYRSCLQEATKAA